MISSGRKPPVYRKGERESMKKYIQKCPALSGMMSVKWSLPYQMTGALWAGLGDHLFNNVVVTNLLHVISNGEADSMQL